MQKLLKVESLGFSFAQHSNTPALHCSKPLDMSLQWLPASK